ncbi:ribonuclease Z [Utexia brackfieldae]|uniref:ribonuclease Z n=1 Tax=Utexia brackfieldae TaxID=3074108 RepID=UPI00370D11A5
MELVFLGTSAGKPTSDRNVTSIVLNLMPERKTIWLFDCGEATQHQLMKTDLRLAKLEIIFITHLHGDHLFGLPGILTSRSLMMNMSPVKLIGPKGIKRFVETVTEVSDSILSYPLEIIELEDEGVVFEDATFKVVARKLEHRIVCYGYRIMQKDETMRLNIPKLQADNIPVAYYPLVKNGDVIELADKRLINAKDYLEPPIKGKIVTILGDTLPCDATIALARDADVLVHEATQGADLVEKANMRGHSTTVQAAEIAQKSQVNHLILTHISPRYPLWQSRKLLKEAQAVFAHTDIAKDLAIFPVN